jgi:hypothetical protein
MIIAIIASFFAEKDYRLEPFFREKQSEMIITINPSTEVTNFYIGKVTRVHSYENTRSF